MALFAGEPAGIQIKKWLIILVSLVVVINVLAAGSLLMLQSALSAIEGKYQPIMISASEISTQVHQAQTSLYKYLGEYLDSTEEVELQTEQLAKTLEEALALKGGKEWSGELEVIRDGLAKYRVVARNLPVIGDETDWSEVDELRSQAVALGQAMEEQASVLRGLVSSRIEAKASSALRLSLTAVTLFLIFLALSIFITVLLLMWWRQFQDMILNL